MSVRKKEYLCNSVQGFLKSIKITTVEHLPIEKISLGDDWVNAELITLMLILDDRWRTMQQMRKYCPTLRTLGAGAITSFLARLEKMGLVESHRDGKRARFRRSVQVSKHDGSLESI